MKKLTTNNMVKKISIAWAIAWAYLINTTATLARWWDDLDIVPSWSTNVDFKSWVMIVINWFLSFLWLVAMAMIVYAGFRMVISQWEEEDFNKAKTQIIYAIIGLIVVILAYSIVKLVSGLEF